MILTGAAGAVVAQNNADSLRASLHTTAAYVAAGNAIQSCRRSPRSSGGSCRRPTCSMTAISAAARNTPLCHSARGPAEYEQLWADPRAAYEYLLTDDEHWQTALNAQRELARLGQHRAVGVADLLTAALSADHHLTVVHYDADFDTAATVLDFQHQWVLSRGSL